MKHLVPLILYFFMCNFIYAQHISEFGSLPPDGQDNNFNLPKTHSFQVLFDTQYFVDIGGVIPDNSLGGPNFDFAGYVPIDGSSKNGHLSINSEMAPGAVTILDIEFDDVLGGWNIKNSEQVDFSLLLGFPTVANCSGTVTPWNTIITCEEYTSIELLQRNTEEGYEWVESTDLDGDGYHDLGWAIEINPETKKVINQNGGRGDKDKLWAMGNFKHENAVIRADHKTVYQGADATNQEGFLFKFVAAKAQDLSQGDLYVYKGNKVNNHSWIKLANTTQEEQNTTIAQCKTFEATPFGGIEDVEINPKDSLVYFAVKRETNEDLGLESKGVVYRFNDTTNGIEDLEIYAGGNSVYQVHDEKNDSYVDVAWGEGNDNLVFDDLGNLWVAQDGDNNYIWVVENGHTQVAPKVKIFARTPLNSEPTGLTFSPDFRYIFMSIQHPENNDSFQTDVFGTPVSFNEDVVLVLARNEYLGKDEVLITQYYHDSEDSKWIEIKNISGNDLSDGKYSVSRYDSSAGDIVSADPIATEILPAMSKDEVLLLKNKPNPAQPSSNFIGNATQIESDVCNFIGDDVILITSTTGNGKYINVKDIIGDNSYSTWGQNKSFLRGGNSSELPEKDFDANKWFELDALEDVNQADVKQNIALGSHVTGPAIWDGSWINNSEPDRTRNVEINSNYDRGSENLNVFDLKIINGASLTFEDNTQGSNNSLIVHRNLEVIDGGELIIGDTESLIMMNPSPIITGEIEKIEKSSPRNHINDITYWASPVSNEQIENVFTNVNSERIFYYDQGLDLTGDVNESTYWDVWVNKSTGEMLTGKGYAAEGRPLAEGSQHEISFKGTPNYGNIQTSNLYYNDDNTIDGPNDNKDNDFNLIGNPYPSAINIESFLETNWKDNGVIDGTVYFWTHATAILNGEYSNSDYVTYNYVGGVSTVENIEVSENIGSAQGFFVRALKDEPVIFDPSMILVNANHQFFKRSAQKNSEKKDRMWLNLKGSDNSFKQLLIGFTESATDAMDNGYDAIYLDGGSQLGFYSLLDERKLVIQGLGSFEASKKIDLGLDVKSEGLNLIIEIDRVEGVLSDVEVILIDYEKGVMHDLKQNGYQFDYNSKGSFLDRFSITFNSTILSTEELDEASKLHMYIKDEELFVDAPEKINEIKIFDVLGRLVISNKPSSKMFQLSLNKISSGSFFIVKATGENMQNLTRKMIKY